MKLTVLGSADAMNAGGRGNSCYLVQAAGAGPLMIDFGPTALMALRRYGVAPAQLGGVVFTHLHGDHTGGFPLLCIEAMFGGWPASRLQVLGPPLTDRSLRQVFDAEHMAPPHRALCLRVTDPQGRAVAFSGDSRICPGLLAAAAGTDLLVADCSKLAPPAGAHATWKEWQEALPQLRAKALLLTHLGADMRARAPTLFDGLSLPLPVRVADDGMIIDLGSSPVTGAGGTLRDRGV